MMVLRFVTHRHAFGALVTLACMFIAPGFAFSIAGDYLLAHQRGRQMRFAAGVGGFSLRARAF